ncbi:Dam family site-specific DNA-(adenine-N6)-methyltransferase [Parvularcula flava]|uniref:Site-specific DNA-methyltransferase (adenine-specific) n=1 Tax=Aquisalinus luteolus TaxID=1566827 RepID=A0A8J3A0B4_9PROT|nr:Dam family site-specific DNA-(adenine-N6)-methyltransferase [Aquisalinus luteolus]NHK26518.1 Dam family site-specific DNA-(adenine-N6)-methyltransferase [Aquisalinus luteolus]GGH92583.1 site-specific DNA-methyltransferase (adenine-specific) [Aquisalinus luteolus]
MNQSKDHLEPFLKWPGGKRWLAPFLKDLIDVEGARYVEPFLGGGALFFCLAPPKALLSDINSDLINTYKQLKQNPIQFQNALYSYEPLHSKEFYYAERSRFYESNFDRAVQFTYLNRTCFNGIYRVNLSGTFNVPIGSKTKIRLPSDDFERTAKQLRRASIQCSDFEKVISATNERDLIYADPPYTVRHNLNGFVKYNDKIFLWEDQVRLHDALEDASSRGASVIVSNANHESIRELYSDWHQYEVNRSSVISANASHRGKTSEILITNFEIEKEKIVESGALQMQQMPLGF